MNIRYQLKTKTKAAHESLDLLVGQLEPFSSATRYSVFLSAMHQLYSIYGADVDWASQAAGLACSVSDLKSAIEFDLNGELNSPASLDSISDDSLRESRQWAVGYVMEGSAMGARYMATQASSIRDDQGQQMGNTYLEKLAADSYQRWPKFVEALNDAQCDTAIAIESANAVFETATKIFRFGMKELATGSR
ncbi:MAG: biliverdin-producing heme oxygenase [Mariniblastus sp.]